MTPSLRFSNTSYASSILESGKRWVIRGVVSMEDVIETMTGVEIVDEDDVAVDMQALAKEKSRMMHQGVASAIPDSKA